MIRPMVFRRSSMVFVSPSFLSGMARTLDLGATFKLWEIIEFNPSQADFLALESDWNTVGDDLRHALATYDPLYASRSA